LVFPGESLPDFGRVLQKGREMELGRERKTDYLSILYHQIREGPLRTASRGE
jgi:hypothetical protein